MKTELQTAVATLGLEKFRRHIFLCADAAEPKCCPREAGLASWEFLKRRLEGIEPRRRRSRWFIARRPTACASACAGRLRWFIPKASGIIRARRRCWSASSRSI